MVCNCSDRPLGIIDSRVVLENGKAYQVLSFGCTNKKCTKYKIKVFEKFINLTDSTDVFMREI